MYQIRIEFTFDSGHRLLDYNGKCAYPHGHTYRAEVFLESQTLDRLGLVYDSTGLKERIKSWVDENWDHAFLMNRQDTELISGFSGVALARVYLFRDQNPSCEVMSRESYEKTVELCGVTPLKVRLWESVNQFAEYHGES